MDIKQNYERWTQKVQEADKPTLLAMANEPSEIEDAFYRDLEFGTAGLRGVLGMGPNRMNIYTVARTTQGLADYLNASFSEPKVAICRDSRNLGELFVQTAAGVLAANGIHAYVYPRIEPTPALSFATRDLGCAAGINITASHNPAQYNGYKVYGPDGCQITSKVATAIQETIDGIDTFDGVRKMPFDEALREGAVEWISESTLDRFIDAVAQQSLTADATSGLSVVYTPLNGAGLECVTRILKRIGIQNVTAVPEQADPDGNFPTCPFPNPEIREALECGLALSDQVKPDLLLATDPDADRVGIAVPHNGDYQLLTGNEVGVLLLDYECQMRSARGDDLSRAVALSTIVSTAMCDAQAQDFGFQLRRTLTGFKYMGEQIGMLEAAGEADRFIFGFEESYGYLAGTHVRDKDAVVASMLICEMASWHKQQGRNLVQAMEQLYAKYGFYRNALRSVYYPGSEGEQKMHQITSELRSNPPTQIAGLAVESVVDYLQGAPMQVINAQPGEVQQTLPSADVIEFALEGGNKLIIRPSGTEPKIKSYVFAKHENDKEAQELAAQIDAAALEILS